MYQSKINIKHNRHARIRWGVHKDTGELIWIDDVEANGLACNCKCACCESALIACTEGEKKTNHFKHKANNDCYYSDEIAEYLKAHEILRSLTSICLPPIGLRIGNRGVTIEPASEFSIRNVVCNHDANHYPPLLTAEIDGQITRIILSFDGYYQKRDYSEFVKEASLQTWNCLEIYLSQIEDGLSVTKEDLYTYVSGINRNKRWVHHVKLAEYDTKLRNAATKLSPDRIRYGDSTDIEYACPLHKREHTGKYYALQNDCKTCEFNLGFLPTSDCLCLAEAQIKSLEDFDTPIEKRKALFIELQSKNDLAIAQKKLATQKPSFPTGSIPAFNPKEAPGYSDVCNQTPNSPSPVYDRLGKRWYWCTDCKLWMPQRNMASFGFSHGFNKGLCKSCNRKSIQSRF